MSDSLSHHGILGQIWGRRRFQNKDGSLTTAGKKRYNRFECENINATNKYKYYSDGSAKDVIKSKVKLETYNIVEKINSISITDLAASSISMGKNAISKMLGRKIDAIKPNGITSSNDSAGESKSGAKRVKTSTKIQGAVLASAAGVDSARLIRRHKKHKREM